MPTPVNSWPNEESFDDLQSLDTLLVELVDPELEEHNYARGMAGRRRKAAVMLIAVWGGTLVLHFSTWGTALVWGLTALLGLHAVRLFRSCPLAYAPISEAELNSLEAWPWISLLVAAKNEESVITHLVKSLCTLDYPGDRYEVWIVDDASTDHTPTLLRQLAQDYPNLHVLHRPPGAGGGKSGALNDVCHLIRGEVLAVFDADAQVPRDVLLRVVPLFANPDVGAVQLRKAIANAPINFWTRGQAVEMCLDAYFQQWRVAVGGIGELRGNGQFVRRAALERCGGLNEETITDDLDLTLRLHLDQWDIHFLSDPAVSEEGVTSFKALWHQRNRWAEGGSQRYLDYWRFICRNRLGVRKTLDLAAFWLIQYVVPTASVPDLLMAIARRHPPILAPVSMLTLMMAVVAMVLGLRQVQRLESPSSSIPVNYFLILQQTLLGLLYLCHWFVVMPSVILRMSIRKKRLRWVKTTHYGAS
jgi:1,2-diacylglycerol 3-beta-glucosyltransferase